MYTLLQARPVLLGSVDMAKTKSWEVSDAFWRIAESLIPERTRDPKKEYRRRVGGGRKPMDYRKVFEGIVYVLRTGCQWKALPKERFGSPSSVHSYFLKWQKQGFFLALWKAGLAEYDEMEGIAWEWQSIDSAMTKAPLARESVGPNPTDRGKNGDQTTSSGGRPWRPLVPRRHRGEPA
jgi:transposase